MMLATADGELWRVDYSGLANRIEKNAAKITRMLAMPDGIAIAIGYSNGQTILFDTASSMQRVLPGSPDAVHDIAVTQDGKTLAIAHNDNSTYIGPVTSGDATQWRILSLSARSLTFTASGMLIAGSPDGLVWVYTPVTKTWECHDTGTADLTHIALSTSGGTALIFNSEGKIFRLTLPLERTSPQ